MTSTTYTKAQIDVLFAALSGAGYTDIQARAAVADLLAAKAPLSSPTFTGTPTVPTATVGTATTQAASTGFVAAALAGFTGSLNALGTPSNPVTSAFAARPTGLTVVYWTTSTQPTNWVTGDVWTQA